MSSTATTRGEARSSAQAQLEHLQMKYVGTGHADTTRYEWAVNMHRDSLAQYLGHSPMVLYMALAENEAVARVRGDLLERMIAPCGVPPPAEGKKTKLEDDI